MFMYSNAWNYNINRQEFPKYGAYTKLVTEN